jgi:two-component system response regulator FixJ
VGGAKSERRLGVPLYLAQMGRGVSGATSGQRATVFVVDDDEAIRESLVFLIKALDLEVRSFASAQDFLARYSLPAAPACLLLDNRMPGMNGLDLQAILREHKIELPVIMMTAYADVPIAVRAMHQGAVDFLEKPFGEQQLLDCLQKALSRDSEQQRTREQAQEIRDRLARLTPREREVMQLVVHGLLNKQIASELSLSTKTVEQHRARVMEKMESDSLASLVRIALAAGLT